MLNKLQHRQMMFEILQAIYQSDVGRWLGFKGGSLLFFFEGLDRFSVDLDFDFIKVEKIARVREKLQQILQPFGLITEEREKRQTLLFLLNYQQHQHGLKIEISKRLSDFTRYEWRSFYGVDVQTMQLEDVLAHKLVALALRNRVANRDFYDVWFLLKKGVRANPAVIYERTGQSMAEYLNFIIQFVQKNLKSSQVMVGLGELLERSRRDFVKAKLKSELLGRLEFYLHEER